MVVLVVDCGFCVVFVVCVGSFQSVSWKFDFYSVLGVFEVKVSEN